MEKYISVSFRNFGVGFEGLEEGMSRKYKYHIWGVFSLMDVLSDLFGRMLGNSRDVQFFITFLRFADVSLELPAVAIQRTGYFPDFTGISFFYG